MKTDVSGPIYLRNKHKRLHETTISIIFKIYENIVIVIHIFDVELYLYYVVIRKILNLSNKKWK